ncbi:hypothetical protein [Okeania sp.]|uniref:hypothetical protein n=1 Tax=Okeania sp. TaxID=3100323 RepID=UPI002B4B2122|nr:hypothetical protein [Okeania sp.]MEB3340478.1 hypothetical protein [Okeania sp.]
MTVIINFWEGKLGDTVFDALSRLYLGHVSMFVINDQNPKDKIYISHYPQVKNYINSWQSIINDTFLPRPQPISFQKHCDRRDSKAHKKVVLYGLNESRIRKFYQKYLNNDLSDKITKYHFIKNNCCTVIVYLICQGLNCSEKIIRFVHLPGIKKIHLPKMNLVLKNCF